MGTKVQVDSYLPRYCSMRDLNHNSDGTSWASFYGESNLSNGQYYCSSLSRAASDSLPGGNKDILKQTILNHEFTFKNQVEELHRLYRVQKDLMDEITRKEQYKNGIPNEASSSNGLLPSQMTPDDAHRRNSSFLFTSSVCDGPRVPIPDIIHSSGGSNLKGKSIRASSSPLQKCGSPKESEASESRPTKVRRMIDLELLPDEYIDLDEVEQQGNSKKSLFPTHCGNNEYQTDASRTDSCSRKPNVLADLNEPVLSEETSADPSVNFFGVPRQGQLAKDLPWKSNVNGTVNNFQYTSKGNGNHWLSSALKEERNTDSGGIIHQTNHLGKPCMPFSPVKSSHQPAGIFPPHPIKENSWPAKANAGLKTFDRTRSFCWNLSVPPSDLAHSWDPSRGRPNSCLTQKSSSVHPSPFLNSASLSKSPQSSVWSNEFLGNGWHMNSHPRSNPGFLGESSAQNGFKELPTHFGKANSFDLNSTGDLDLNVALPNDSSSELVAEIVDTQVKREKPSGCRKILGVPIFEKLSSREEEIGSGSRKVLLDINVPCEEAADFDDSANMIDLNACAIEDESHETPSMAPVIDLEAPIDLDTEEDDSFDSADKERATLAAEAIVAISSYSAASEDTLAWFADIVCSDHPSPEPDHFEEMTLELTECSVEEYFPNPPVFDIPTVDETGPTSLSGRARRGPARRGRQRRDFQRDILPGLTTLARHEVTEDLQTFGGLMRATGHAWNCGARKSGSKRGRKKSVAVPPPPPPQIANDACVVSLTSWGKTTRRPRRQRCSSAAAAGNVPQIGFI